MCFNPASFFPCSSQTGFPLYSVIPNDLKERIVKIDADIEECKHVIDESNVINTISDSTLEKCVDIVSIIKDLEKQISKLEETKIKIKDSNEVIEYANLLLSQKESAILKISESINNELRDLCMKYGYDPFNSPKFEIRNTDLGYYMSYRTPGNSSESAEFRGLSLYDLVLCNLYQSPFMIHDSSILGRLDTDALKMVLNEYNGASSQIFIAYDDSNIDDEEIINILNQNKSLRIDSKKGLFGEIWSISKT